MANEDFSIIKPASFDDTGSFTRSGTAAYFDSAGAIQNAATDTPRLTYDPVTLLPLGYLVEAAATNYVLHSDFKTGTSGYSFPAGGITDNGVDAGATAVNHVAGARKITVTVDGAVFRLGDTSSGTPGTTYGGGLWIMTADASTKTVTTDVNDDVTRSYSVTGTWKRISTTGTDAASTKRHFDVALPTGTYYVWGGQLQDGNLSSYIPTTTTTVTRNAETCTLKVLTNISEPKLTGSNQDPALWVAATNYATGTQVTRTTTHKVYQRLSPGGVDATLPETDAALATPTKWVEVKPTNRWSALDTAVETQSANEEFIVFCLHPGTVADAVACLNLDATDVRVVVCDSEYDQTQSLYERDVVDWLTWLFGEFDTKTEAVFFDLPPRSTNYVNVIIRNPGGVAKVGNVVLGRRVSIGATNTGATAGITDYSTKETDAFGNTEVVERSFSKRMTVTVQVPDGRVDATQRILAQYRATPLVYVGAGNLYDALIVYGFFRSFEVVIAYVNYSLCNLEVEGLT